MALQASTVSEAIAATPPVQRLSHLHSGSWINADYKIWIGHHEDNRGWELLDVTRRRLTELSKELPPDRAERAWDELYAAEGSDWFWWYGDDFDTDFKSEFDRLFRTHLRNVWIHMGLSPPDQLSQSIPATTVQSDADRVMQPLALLAPTIDGMVTDFFEWRGAGSIKTDPPLGAMGKGAGIFSAIQFGWSHERLYVRFDFDPASEARQADMTVSLMLIAPRRTYRMGFSLAEHGPGSFTLFESGGQDEWREAGTYQSIARRAIVELAVPWKDLHLESGQEIGLSIVALEHGLEVARYPHQSPARLTVPGPEFEAGLWRV
jgi:hypothetical protein